MTYLGLIILSFYTLDIAVSQRTYDYPFAACWNSPNTRTEYADRSRALVSSFILFPFTSS